MDDISHNRILYQASWGLKDDCLDKSTSSIKFLYLVFFQWDKKGVSSVAVSNVLLLLSYTVMCARSGAAKRIPSKKKDAWIDIILQT